MASASKPLADYALIGDTQSCALVSNDGSIDWLCLPNFDSEACFAAILDRESGGHWRIAPAQGVTEFERAYRGPTMVLETTLTTPSGTVAVVDLMAIDERTDPRAPRGIRPRHIVVRQVEGIAGRVPMTMDFRPRFGYGDVTPWIRTRHGGVVEAVGGRDALDLVGTVPLRIDDDAGVIGEFEVAAGERAAFVCSYHGSHLRVEPREATEAPALLASTEDFWRQWAGRFVHEGRWHDPVLRSMLTLKALTFSPTGGVVAAPTTSLPEQIGGPRNWDYRFCWLRDATFTLGVLLHHGYTEEAAEWRDWLLRAVAGDPQDMQIMYGLHGERHLYEHELPWLSGYEGSRPVRIGNAAHGQFQLDVYGEVMDSFHLARRAGLETSSEAWELELRMAEFVAQRWDEPDEGIWEFRSGPRHFTHSKVMAWVAIDRAVRAVEEFGLEGPVAKWRALRDEIKRAVLEHGVHDRHQRFKQAYDIDELDASLLMLPLVGFIEADAPVMRATIEQIREELVVDGFVLRYRTDLVDDGLPPGEATFLMCTFWLVDCLVLLGRDRDAEDMFERLCALANDVGLFGEQYDPQLRRMLGNFPQAFSHVALVTSAMALDYPRGTLLGPAAPRFMT